MSSEAEVYSAFHEEAKSEHKGRKSSPGQGSRKLCRTLDDNNPDESGNLYVLVRQKLQKVNRVSRSSLPPLKRSNSEGDFRSVLQDSGVSRFAAIKAFFDRDDSEVKGGPNFPGRTTIMSRIIKSLGLSKENSRYSESDFSAEVRDINDNLVLK